MNQLALMLLRQAAKTELISPGSEAQAAECERLVQKGWLAPAEGGFFVATDVGLEVMNVHLQCLSEQLRAEQGKYGFSSLKGAVLTPLDQEGVMDAAHSRAPCSGIG